MVPATATLRRAGQQIARVVAWGMPLCLVLLALPVALQAQPLVRPDLQVVIQPQAHRLQVTDTITLPTGIEDAWHFQVADTSVSSDTAVGRSSCAEIRSSRSMS